MWNGRVNNAVETFRVREAVNRIAGEVLRRRAHVLDVEWGAIA